MKRKQMKTLCTHAGVCRGIVGLLVAAAAMACSGGKEAAPPATAAATTGGGPIGDRRAHPANGIAVRRPSGSRAARDGQAVHR